MSWARFDDNMATHPKCAPLSDLAFRLMVHANLWSRAQRTGGFVPRDMLPTFLPGRTHKALSGAAEELVHAGGSLHLKGLWEPEDKGWRIHDFDDYGNPNVSEVRLPGESGRGVIDPELSRKRAEAGRRGGQLSGLIRSRIEGPGQSSPWPSALGDQRAVHTPKQVASPAEANPAKQNASPPEAREFPHIDPNPKPDPSPDPNKPPFLPPEANEQKAKQESLSKLDGLPSAVGQRLQCDNTPLGERAKSHFCNSRVAETNYGSPLDWPELQTIWRVFESTWGKADRPRETSDPRVRVVLERFASGRTPDELSRAIRSSKRYAPVADNPSYQRIKTILKDDEQVDNLLRLADAPAATNGRSRLKQQGGWKAPETERVSCE